jgi:hemoglobin/transferrin/lactoferrin receptor protein
MILKKLSIILFVWCTSFVHAHASCSDTLKVKTFETVNITAFRFQLKNHETPGHIITFSKKNLTDNIPRSLPEFFDGLGNVYVQKTNHGGGSLFIRGLTGNQTLLTIDGIRLNNSTFRYGPNQYLNTINANMVDKIEVLAGSGSVQYGSDAIGGLVQIFSISPNFDKKIGLNLNTSWATQNMEKSINGALNLSNKKVGLVISGAVKNFGDLVSGKGIQTPSGYKEHSLEGKFVWKIYKNASLTAAHQSLVQKDVPIYHKIILENFALNHISSQNRNLSYLKFANKTKSKFFTEQEITLSQQLNSEARIQQKNGSSTIRNENDKIQTTGISLVNISKFNTFWQASSGFEAYFDLVNSLRNDATDNVNVSKRGLYPNKSTYANNAFFTMHQFTLKSSTVNAGVRYNTVMMNIPDEKLGASNIKNGALVYNLSFLQKINATFVAYASYNTAFRSPNIDDMGTLGIVDFRYEIPSDKLKPEMSKQIEIGFKFQNKVNSGQISVYHNKLTDLITREKIAGQFIENYPVYIKQNTSKATNKGFEWSSKSTISKNWQFDSFLTYTFGQDDIKNEPLRRIPPFFSNFKLVFRQNNFSISPGINLAAQQKRLAQGDKDDNRIGPNGTPAYAVFNTNMAYQFQKFSIKMNLQNITNQLYKTHGSGIYGYGRSVFFNLAYDL